MTSLHAGVCAILIVLAGCVGTSELRHGSFARIGTVEFPVEYALINAKASGESCGPAWGRSFDLATQDALARNPGANALLHAVYSIERECVRVEASAVKVKRR